ncbi:MAG: hypothetical protein Q7T05_00420 [Dehalococcoidia bacterium]|nr:hypothetical protein [Dehalococcoidia bacterium]
MSELSDFEDRKHAMIESCESCVDLDKDDYDWPCGACGVQDGDEEKCSYFMREVEE